MVELGQYNRLRVVKNVDFGVYLSQDGDDQEILLPLKYVPENTDICDYLNVFVYNDSENRIIATTLEPYATVGEFAYLTVVDVTEHGAFLDMGIAKDVFVPEKQQTEKMRLGREYVVYLYIDEKSNRIAATMKWNKFIFQEELDLAEGDEVRIIVVRKTDLGYTVIVNDRYLGLVYQNDIFEPIAVGDRKQAFVKKIREENKLDISLRKQGFEALKESKDVIINYLNRNGGILPLGDKSSPDDIYSTLHLSKKAFKKLAGNLYKEGKIMISDFEIKLNSRDI